MLAFACWQLLQVHVSPQLQTSPHWHQPVGAGVGFWPAESNVEGQPQVH
jgi:hypothetical protein